ncbi:hypothetical protein [Phyllobacterium zundukense]|uniref:Uncharacterized protein n=1 Tax=Phyllobacterium zundukense TaxID=1867719 RepID=A0A2N9VWX0_9HYPH|nr:hypothetical protein [Phyllobacterium zundukense]ATU90249.1 hypothetical protein BLM14_00105 [Phyllobacterium zundukense]PIO43988.1 hypothetical protein B5P45_15575 [Phyllobacterium zundukense]
MPEQDNKPKPDTESRRILDRVNHESATGGLSVVERAKGHFSAEDADAADPIEIWGTRIGRFLGLLVLIAMFIWFLSSFFGMV